MNARVSMPLGGVALSAQAAMPLVHRAGDWIQTYSGTRFYPLDPRPEEIHVADIAHALSMTCRYAGHCTKFYSVAEHSVHMMRRATAKHRKAALLHDASEAYLTDVPRPIKPRLTGYYAAEDKLMSVIAARFGFEYPLSAEVKHLDAAMLSDERAQAMGARPESPEEWGNSTPGLGVKLEFWPPPVAKEEFFTAFYELGGL